MVALLRFTAARAEIALLESLIWEEELLRLPPFLKGRIFLAWNFKMQMVYFEAR